MLKSKSNRIGRFMLRTALLRDAADHMTHEADAEFFAIFRRVIIVEAKAAWPYDAIEYLGFCDQFDSVELGCESPWYDVDIVRSEASVGGVPVMTYEPKFTRRKERS